jgi:hypothetical protein
MILEKRNLLICREHLEKLNQFLEYLLNEEKEEEVVLT